MVHVQVSEGILEGEEVQNEYGGTFYSFKGIPYAQPPLGELRFKIAQPVQPWTGVRSANKFGPICYQHDVWEPTEVVAEPETTMSEDCLYLNIYTPDTSPRRLLPVMVFIHGGALVCGSGNDDYYGPQFLIRHGVLLVTLNYRLEVLGFLCLHSADIPGNIGVKDQVAALRWLKRNVGNFGGDPENITIFGESSGANCVSYHLISPMTKGLIRRAIMQSGAATCWLGEEFGSRDKAILLAKQLGCFSEDNKTLYEFFKKQPVEKLVNLKLSLWKSQKPFDLHFSIVNEKDFGQERFFYGDITDTFRRGAHEGVEIMTGYNKDDGLTSLALGCSLKELIYEAKYFNEFFIPGWIKRHCVIDDQFKVGSKMRQFYVKDGGFTDNRNNLMRFINMDLYFYAVILLAKILSKKNKVYFYKFTCISNRNVFARVDLPEPIEGEDVVCHGDDLSYLFPLRVLIGKVDEKSEEFKAINRVTKLWTNFAKYGNPTPTPDDDLAVEWKPYTIEKQECLDLGNTLTMVTIPEKEELEFWENIFREYIPKYTS